MITINIKDGKGSISAEYPFGRICDPPVGTVIKYVTEEGDEYFVVTSEPTKKIAIGACHGCVFSHSTGHPLSKIFHNTCDASYVRVLCYDRIYKPLDSVLEDL